MKQEKFNFRFLNTIMYIGTFIILFYVLKNLGIMSKLVEILVALIPVFIGIIVCWLSTPLKNKLTKLGLKNNIAAIISLVIIFGVLIIVFSIIIPIMVSEITKLVVELPNIYTGVVTKINDFLYSKSLVAPGEGISLSYSVNTVDLVKKNLNNILNYSINTVQSITSSIISIFTVVVIAFFMVKDLDKFKAGIVSFFAKNDKESRSYKIIEEIDTMLMSYIKGVLLDSFIVGILVTIACFILGIDYAIIFGVLIFILNMIPYIGALLSELTISLFALSTGGLGFAIITFLVMLGIQIFDSNVLQPNIVAKSVNLHPVTVFCGLIIFNLLMGFVGMIIAVPCIVIIKIILKYSFSLDEKGRIVKNS